MRAPVYRNLDTPFRIAGFSPLQLSLLCVAFVGGGEVAQMLGIGRIWALALTLVLALALFAFHRAFGEHFGARLIRFGRLPSHMSPRLLPTGLRR